MAETLADLLQGRLPPTEEVKTLSPEEQSALARYFSSDAGKDAPWYLPEELVGDLPYRYQGVGWHGALLAPSLALARQGLNAGRMIPGPAGWLARGLGLGVGALTAAPNAWYVADTIASGRTQPRPKVGPVSVLEGQPY